MDKPDDISQGRKNMSSKSINTQPQETPILERLRGRRATMAAYTGHHGHTTIEAVMAQIPPELRDRLTGHELGLVMSVVNDAYHNGRASHGGLDLCDDAVWYPWGGGSSGTGDNPSDHERGQMIPIEALRRIKVNGKRYTLDFTEGVVDGDQKGGQP